jgi:hypothetical protein
VRWSMNSEKVGGPLFGLLCHRCTSLLPVSLKRWRHAVILPCPVSTAVSFGVRLIFIPSLSRNDRKYCFVAAALNDVVHSVCHFCMASSAASYIMALLGILVYS